MMITLSLFVLGLCFGSFVNALVWRLHKKRNFVSERSECTHCHHLLSWYDLVPVLSWVFLKGKCRYCHKKIDDNPLVELGVAGVFALSYVAWPLGFSTPGIILFVLWLIVAVLMAALLVYDMRWMLLPNVLMFPLIAIGVVWTLVQYGWLTPLSVGTLFLHSLYGIASVAGLYGLLYLVSKGEWIGLGDVKLGIFMGLVLGWAYGLLAVVLANLIAFLAVVPGLMSGKLNRTARIPFGPFLIVATGVSFLYGRHIIGWYLATFLVSTS